LSLAQKLILQNKPFAITAELCGFNDYSNFLRAFTAITAETPSSYRNRIENPMQFQYAAAQNL
jgi:AraC-like DNA-binding protein